MKSNLIAILMLSLVFTGVVPAKADDLLKKYGKAAHLESLPSGTYSLVTWNVYKNQKEGIFEQMGDLAKNNDFVLLQEFEESSEQVQMIQSLPGLEWGFAKSFQDGDNWTGVSIASRWQAKSSVAVKSNGAEPFTDTPKMTLINTYSLVSGEVLMVVTMHALNFDITGESFREHVDQIITQISSHKGPLLFAGDFNTWTEGRREYLIEKTQSIGLSRANLENPMGIFSKTLDHVFYRGVDLKKWNVLESMDASDHLPFRIEFELK